MKQIWRTAEDAATPEMNYYSSNSGRRLTADGAAGVLHKKNAKTTESARQRPTMSPLLMRRRS
jgi:hypothetical protein